jgi:hypothetical protein
MRRKFVLGAMALALPLGMAVTMGAGSATARSNLVTGTGLYSCSKITGTISFNPPLSNTAKIETTTVKATASGCHGTAKPAVVTAISSSTTKGTKPSSCATLVSATTAVKFAQTYTPAGTAPSTFTGSAKGAVVGGKATFAVTGTVAGSYKTTANSAKANAVISQTPAQIGTMCATTGVKTLNIASGTVTNN